VSRPTHQFFKVSQLQTQPLIISHNVTNKSSKSKKRSLSWQKNAPRSMFKTTLSSLLMTSHLGECLVKMHCSKFTLRLATGPSNLRRLLLVVISKTLPTALLKDWPARQNQQSRRFVFWLWAMQCEQSGYLECLYVVDCENVKLSDYTAECVYP